MRLLCGIPRRQELGPWRQNEARRLLRETAGAHEGKFCSIEVISGLPEVVTGIVES